MTRVRSMDVLVQAWHAIRRNAETSKSRSSREKARQFGSDLPRNLKKIQGRLGHSYKFAQAIGATPPKGKGKPGKRPLVITSLDDRIVQRALLDVVQDANHLTNVQNVLSTPTSIGGIRGKSVGDAIQKIEEAYHNGARHVAGSDISGFFNCVPRLGVMDFLRSEIHEEAFCDLLERAMTVDLANAERLDPDDLRMFPTGEDGVAQGCPLSTLAGNIALHSFDEAMNEPGRGVVCIRYIDDFILLADERRKVVKALESAGTRLKELKMDIYSPTDRPDKAFIGSISEGCEFLGYKIIPGIYPPADKPKANLLSRVSEELRFGRNGIATAIETGASSDRLNCYAQTLNNIDRILRGWKGSFRASKCEKSMAELDAAIDRQLHDFHHYFDRKTRGTTAADWRRALGVRLLGDP